MPNFLTSIAERALGVAPVAQPIIAPMFAPKPVPSTLTPTFLEEEEVLEPLPPSNIARRSSSLPVIQPAFSIAPIAHQPVVSPAQPSSGTIGRSESPLISSPMQQKEAPTNQIGAKAVSNFPGESKRMSQENEHTIPALPVTTPVPPEGDIKEHTITDSRDFPGHRQGTRRETVTQAPSPEGHEQPLIEPAEQQGSMIQPVVETKNSQNPTDQPRATVAQAVSKRLGPEVPSSSDRRVALPREQDLLVPQRANIAGRLVEHNIARSQTNDLLPVYEQDTSTTGRRLQGGATPEEHSRRAAEPRPAGSAEASSAAPTVRVTIGRVDVRAITSPAPASRPKPTRSGPTLSLEDYAQQNRGGR